MRQTRTAEARSGGTGLTGQIKIARDKIFFAPVPATGDTAQAVALKRILTEDDGPVNGLSVWYLNEATGGNIYGGKVAALTLGALVNLPNVPQTGDLVLTLDGYLYYIASVSGSDFTMRYTGGSLKGPKGDKGATGATGPQGSVGPQGPAGSGTVETSYSSPCHDSTVNSMDLAPYKRVELDIVACDSVPGYVTAYVWPASSTSNRTYYKAANRFDPARGAKISVVKAGSQYAVTLIAYFYSGTSGVSGATLGIRTELVGSSYRYLNISLGAYGDTGTSEVTEFTVTTWN